MHRVRRLLAELGSKQGRGTELISLYIPPKKPLYDVINNLREEAGTASNIKSDTTRNHVLDALTRVTQRLKLYKAPPETGLVVFCGALPVAGPNTETIQIFEIVPPRVINTYLYRCDDHFHLDLLKDTLREEEAVGIMSIDTAEAALGRLVGDNLQVIEVLTSGIAGKHRQGGQSARRFERLRENEVNGFFTRVADHAARAFIGESAVKKLVIGGPGPTKDDFYKGNYMDYRLQNAVLSVIDTSYTGEEGIREIVQKATPILQDVRLVQEDALVDKFIGEASKDYGLAVYGLNNVIETVNNNSAGTIIISEDLDLWRLVFRCKKCQNTRERFGKKTDIYALKAEQADIACAACGSKDWELQEQQDLVDYMFDRASTIGAEVEVISGKTEHGQMFNSFGGIGAILRYRAR
ncbi:MAG: peptide chain release factor aRF-1 [Nitrososphaerota archaeon]|nr:peptide chain release factor aRF-1 [Nitrososphaerota archaeon]